MDRKRLIYLLSLIGLFAACQPSNHTPKPRGYFRIEFPDKAYQPYPDSMGCPFTFRVPVYAQLIADTSESGHPCWSDLAFPRFNARIHFSYMPVNSEEMLYQLVEDSRDLAFKHTIKATAIDEQLIVDPERDVYGIVYAIRGNTASSLQFFLTDSTRHYLRGALYFHEEPRIDSIRPVLEFIREDIDTLLSTFRWR